MFNKVKDSKFDEAKIEIRNVVRLCIYGPNENDVKITDPDMIGFDQFEFVDARLKYVKNTYSKEITKLEIDLDAVEEKYEQRKNESKGRTLK
jgi:hypothetical protein